ncbi:MAG: glycosyltransferase family 2 protein [Patescibacteria group bacterium]|nr:glycosyltransferase family 2 protein [Patescibacteria group bacterium]
MTRLGTRRTKPLVSVIMPVYNAERYLDQAIASLRKQTEPRFELLIIDDGSTDASWKKLRLYARTEQRIRLWRNPKNIGLALSLNRLLPKTRGQYIARMDADDVAFPRRLAQQVAFLQSHPTVVACGGQIKIIDRRRFMTFLP